jgi:antitoxin VapB
MNEQTTKLTRIRALLDDANVDALWLQLASSFAWATCGHSSYINTASSTGAASLLVTRDTQYVITTNIEEPRLAGEEGLAAAGWQFPTTPWYGGRDALAELTKGLRLGVDGCAPGAVDLSGEVSRLRTALLPEEGARFRELGRLCAAGMDEAIRSVKPGLHEQEIAGLLAGAVQRRGVQPIVVLIATDERIFKYRHPLPGDKRLDKYAMLVLCGRRQGLVASVTRLVHFGPLSDELKRKQEAVAKVDAAFIYGSRPNVTLGDIFAQAQATYAATGFADEWKLHHQGGPAAYEPREYLGLPGGQDEVREGMALAWNPSITGTKMEDTILVGPTGNEILTAIPGWPTIPVEIGGGVIERPAILVLE